MLMLALPGCAYIYQGEELGLPQVEDLPDEVLQDPAFLRSGGETRGRDGCRVPLPWSGTSRRSGSRLAGVTPWLPQPEEWASLTAEAQAADPDSTLSMYRDALRLRREIAGFVGEDFSWRSRPRAWSTSNAGDGVRCVINLSRRPSPAPVPAGPSRWPAHRSSTVPCRTTRPPGRPGLVACRAC